MSRELHVERRAGPLVRSEKTKILNQHCAPKRSAQLQTLGTYKHVTLSWKLSALSLRSLRLGGKHQVHHFFNRRGAETAQRRSFNRLSASNLRST